VDDIQWDQSLSGGGYACGTLNTSNANDLLLADVQDGGNTTNPANPTAGSGFTIVG
jgi:hypothetical protein